MNKAFSTKPCLGNSLDMTSADVTKLEDNVTVLEEPVRRIVSRNCLVWSGYSYDEDNSFAPAMCHACKNLSLDSIHGDGHSERTCDSFTLEQKLAEGQYKQNTEVHFDPYDGKSEGYLELDQVGNLLQGEFVEVENSSLSDADLMDASDDNSEDGDSNPIRSRRSRFKCEICGKKFSHERNLSRHQSQQHGEEEVEELECADCGKGGFKNKASLYSHRWEFHMERTRHSCPEPGCDFSSVKKTTARVHRERVHSDKPLKCEFCGKKYERKDARLCSCRGVKLKCELCGKSFKDERGLKSHHTTLQGSCENKNRNIKCELCDKTFTSTGMKIHATTMHKPSDFAPSRYKCPVCGDVFDSNPNYSNHLRSLHEDECLECDGEGCGFACASAHVMEDHKLAHEKELEQTKEEEGDMKSCDICGEQVRSTYLFRHYRKVHNVRSRDGHMWVCRQCGETFKTKHGRQIHINREHLKITFDCEECGKQFNSKEHLRQHMFKVHMKERRRKQCDVCLKWFWDQEVLHTHVRKKHTGEKPFQCPYCDESFFSNNGMGRHRLQKHPDSWKAEKRRRDWLYENPGGDPSEYKARCHLCREEVRGAVDALRAHWEESHPGQTDLPSVGGWRLKAHTCELCGESYREAIVLRRHLFEDHEGTACPECKAEFPDRDSAVRHRQESHPAALQMHRTKKNKLVYPSQVGYPGKKEMCDICGKIQHNMRLHMRLHDKSFSRPTSCTYCGKDFPLYENMTRHRRVAHREQWNVDKDKLMAEEGSKYAGKEHPWTKHIGEKFKCEVCGVTLSSKQQLKKHLKSRHGVQDLQEPLMPKSGAGL